MPRNLEHLKEEVLKKVEAGHIFDTSALEKGMQFIKESEFLREWLRPGSTFESLSQAAINADRELQKLFPSKSRFSPQEEGGGAPSGAPSDSGIDTGAAEQFAAGCAVVAAVADSTVVGAPIGAAFGIAAAVATAIVVFSKAQ